MDKKQMKIGDTSTMVNESPQHIQIVATRITIQGVGIFVPESEYERVVAENTHLRQRIIELEGVQTQLRLANKDRELLVIKAENEALKLRIVELEKKVAEQSIKIDEQSNKIGQLEDELNTMKVYQKFVDSSKTLFSDLYDVFCGDQSEIRTKSHDNDLYHLSEHLLEVHTHTYKTRKVRTDLQLWTRIYHDIITLLQAEFKITDINVFFEMIHLRESRNMMSHHTEQISLYELKHISPLYADQIWPCLQ